MPNVNFEQTSNVTGQIEVTISKEELHEKLNAELKKQRQKVNMKGFRKGKTPLSTLRKMMGNQVLGQILDDQIRESLFGYIEDNDIKLIFSPMPNEDKPAPALTAQTLQDITLAYDLALEPEFTLELPEKTFEKYVLDTNDEFLDEQIERLLKQQGNNEEVEDGTVEAEDILDVTFTEAGPMEDPMTNSAKLYMDSLTEETRDMLLGKKVGFSTTISDLNTLEKNSTDAYVKKYLLELEDTETDISGKSFELKIDKISRIIPAKLDEEFFAKFDGSGAVKTEEDLRQRIADDNASGFDRQGESMVNFAIQRDLVEDTEIELPLELMEKIHQEDPNGTFDMFQRGVRWMLIRNKFAAEQEVKLEYEDVRAEAMESLMGMLGGQRPDFLTDEFIDNYVGQMLQDEKQREQLSSNAIEKKIMAAIREKVSIEDKPVDADTFNEVIKTFNEENTPAQEEE